MVKKLMGLEVFSDPVGTVIKARLMNYAMDKYGGTPENLEASVDRLSQIILITRKAIEDCLDAELDVLLTRNDYADTEPVSVIFMAGINHSLDVIRGDESLIGKL